MDNVKNSSEIVYRILEQTQLENFWPKIRDDLQISRLSHFHFVKSKDFDRIGLSKPAIRRLLDHVKKVESSLNQRNSVSFAVTTTQKSAI
jgi:activated CDC42 kinase 1